MPKQLSGHRRVRQSGQVGHSYSRLNPPKIKQANSIDFPWIYVANGNRAVPGRWLWGCVLPWREKEIILREKMFIYQVQ